MQVTQENDHITHAVIGGGKTIDFGISTNAEFFHILSSTLYTDQILAVVREVLCNAWDAHIEAGKTDTPIKVTLVNNEFIVQDFGNGIAKEDIGTVYGVYGQSTKKANGNVTGGFGLGCKAPFAYVDHFEVTSCNAGEKTIYRMSKSSSQVNGKPGITPVISLPTEETGLTVKLSINSSDHGKFVNNIETITRLGEMNATFKTPYEECVAKVIPFSKAEHGFTILSRRMLGTTKTTTVFIRYGHVIYPVEWTELPSNLISQINSLLLRMQDSSTYISERLVLVLHAPPHSISVTPSREALSMQELTVRTISELAERFLRYVAKNEEGQYLRALKQQLLLTPQSDLKPGSKLMKLIANSNTAVLQSIQQIADYVVSYGTPSGSKYSKHMQVKRVEALLKKPGIHLGLVQTYLDEVKKYEATNATTDWFVKRVYAPLFSDISKVDPTIRKTALALYEPSYMRNREASSLIQLDGQDCLHLDAAFKYLTNFVILTCTKKIEPYRVNKIANERVDNATAYYCKRTNKNLAEVRKMLATRKDTTFIDLTIKHHWEQDKESVPYKRRIGIPKLSNARFTGYGWPDFDCLITGDKDGLDRTSEPKFIVKAEKGRRMLEAFSGAASATIVQLYGDVGAHYTSTIQYEKYKEQGALTLKEFLAKELIKEFANNQRIRRHLSNKPSRVAAMPQYRGEFIRPILDVLVGFPGLAKPLNLFTKLTERDENLLRLLTNIESTFNLYRHPELGPLYDTVRNIPISQSIIKAAEIAKDNIMMKVISVDSVSNILRNNTTPEKTKVATDLVNLLLANFK